MICEETLLFSFSLTTLVCCLLRYVLKRGRQAGNDVPMCPLFTQKGTEHRACSLFTRSKYVKTEFGSRKFNDTVKFKFLSLMYSQSSHRIADTYVQLLVLALLAWRPSTFNFPPYLCWGEWVSGLCWNCCVEVKGLKRTKRTKEIPPSLMVSRALRQVLVWSSRPP